MLENEKKHIKQAQEGHHEAFSVIYSHYLPQIYRFVFLKTGNKATAEDLTHESFLSAWKNLKKYEDLNFPFSSWLYQIARNKIIDFYRTNKKNLQLDNIDESAIAIENNNSSLDSQIDIEKIKILIKQLKPDYQDILIMRFIDDLSCEEIAIAIKKSQGAVRLLQHRALNALKQLYERDNKKN